MCLLTPPMKMEQCSETSAYKIQEPGIQPKERIQHEIICPTFMSTSGLIILYSLILLVWILRIWTRPCSFGNPISICTYERPVNIKFYITIFKAFLSSITKLIFCISIPLLKLPNYAAMHVSFKALPLIFLGEAMHHQSCPSG
jgi:hypothetical protein